MEVFVIDESLFVYIYFGNINGNLILKVICILNYSFVFGDIFCFYFEYILKYLLSRVFVYKYFYWIDKEFWLVFIRRGI